MNLLTFLAQIPTLTPSATAVATDAAPVTVTPTPTATPFHVFMEHEPFWNSSLGIFIVIAVVLAAGVLVGLAAQKSGFGSFVEKLFADFTNVLAYVVVTFAFLGIFAISWQVIKVGGGQPFNATKALETAKFVFGAILPLLGTWVGAVLAHYFQKESLAAATHSISDRASKVAGTDKLQSVPVKSVMIRPDRIQTLPDALLGKDDKEIPLADLVKHLRETIKLDRLPLFKNNQKAGPAARVVHLSLIEKFITQKTVPAAGAPPSAAPSVAGLSLADLMADPQLGPVVRGSFALVKSDATLADAKKAMDKASSALGSAGNCYDVFVTDSGSPDDPVIGWITNDIINDNAKV
jgi:hypothetical protein